MDHKISTSAAGGMNLFWTCWSLERVTLLFSVIYFLASRVFLYSFIDQQSAEICRETLCPSQELFLHPSLFPLVLFPVDYLLLTSLGSEVLLLSSGWTNLAWSSAYQPRDCTQAVICGSHSVHLFLFFKGSLFCLVWYLMYNNHWYILCVIFNCFRWEDKPNSHYSSLTERSSQFKLRSFSFLWDLKIE